MKKTSRPPEKANAAKPLTAKRQKILATAMAQLKKTRSQMDPAILKKIRTIIASNPKIMKGLGIDKMPAEKSAPSDVNCLPCESRDLHREVKKKGAKDSRLRGKDRGREARPKQEEKIDQVHNMEVMAKLMALKPSEIKNIKSVLLKGKD